MMVEPKKFHFENISEINLSDGLPKTNKSLKTKAFQFPNYL